MPSTIKNLDKQLLTIPLNSGGSLHLAPGETSPPLPEYELIDNPKVTKLAKAGLITLPAPTTEPPLIAEQTTKRRKPKKIK